MRVLVVEDDAKIRRFLEKALKEAGYTVETAADAASGRHQALSGGADAVVLDLGLPDGDGLEVLKALRAAKLATPVLVLTAQGGSAERVRGLDAGADDYLEKPFALDEVLARLRALLRRGSPASGTRLSYEDLEMDLATRRVVRGGREIPLTNKEFALLELLLRAPGEVLPRSVIAQKLWDDNFESFSNVIDVHVRRLRQKLGEPALIQTVKGTGYALRR